MNDSFGANFRSLRSLRAVLGGLVSIFACGLLPTAAAAHGDYRVLSLDQTSGTKGTLVKVTGAGISGEVRWNSTDGPVLAAEAAGPDGELSTEVLVPNVPPGIYFIVVRSGDYVVRAPFEVIEVMGEAKSAGVALGNGGQIASTRIRQRKDGHWAQSGQSPPAPDSSRKQVTGPRVKGGLGFLTAEIIAGATALAALAAIVLSKIRRRGSSGSSS